MRPTSTSTGLNRQNVSVWSDKPPKQAIETPLVAQSHRVVRHGSKECHRTGLRGERNGEAATVTQEKCQEFFVIFKLELKGRCGSRQVNWRWLQQDGASPPHTASAAIEWLGEHFPGRVMGKLAV